MLEMNFRISITKLNELQENKDGQLQNMRKRMQDMGRDSIEKHLLKETSPEDEEDNTGNKKFCKEHQYYVIPCRGKKNF